MLYDAKFSDLFHDAENGELYAIDELSHRYLNGKGVTKSLKLAREYNEKILERSEYAKQFYGRFEAIYSLVGDLYFLEGQHEKAFEFYLRAKKFIIENYPLEEQQERMDWLKLDRDLNSFPQFSSKNVEILLDAYSSPE